MTGSFTVEREALAAVPDFHDSTHDGFVSEPAPKCSLQPRTGAGSLYAGCIGFCENRCKMSVRRSS